MRWCAEHDSALRIDRSSCDARLLAFDQQMPVTDCRLVEALLIVKENGEWPESVIEQVMEGASFRSHDIIVAILDALAAAGGDSQ